MSTKTVYVPEEDVTLWEQMGVIASRERRSVSYILHDAIRRYLQQTAVEEVEKAEQAFRETIAHTHEPGIVPTLEEGCPACKIHQVHGGAGTSCWCGYEGHSSAQA